jgi:hypothetical protein
VERLKKLFIFKMLKIISEISFIKSPDMAYIFLRLMTPFIYRGFIDVHCCSSGRYGVVLPLINGEKLGAEITPIT